MNQFKENCIFCKIIEKKNLAEIIYEDENFLAFLDIDPINKGHLLIIPKIHVLDLDELEDSLLLKLTLLSKKLLIQLKKEYNLDGYTIMQNGGDFNDIGHLHVHLFPRYHNDGFDWVYRKE